ncbi:MAG TPA: DUF402 domain-containing protein [Gaiellaceae bacterium]|nr:DUF402 domain-containing protein [Gaiellaceae bacterium]
MPVLADGRGLRDVPLAERWSHPRATELRPWTDSELLMIFPRGRLYSLWIFRRHGEVLGWYVNLEEAHVIEGRTITTRDGVLDIWVPAETGEPQWKDEDEFAVAIEVGRIAPDEAVALRAEGERVIAERPWPTGLESWRPPPDLAPLTLPEGWDYSSG